MRFSQRPNLFCVYVCVFVFLCQRAYICVLMGGGLNLHLALSHLLNERNFHAQKYIDKYMAKDVCIQREIEREVRSIYLQEYTHIYFWFLLHTLMISPSHVHVNTFLNVACIMLRLYNRSPKRSQLRSNAKAFIAFDLFQ